MRPHRILVVDDDYVVREELLRVLRAEDGLSAISARDGESALVAMRSATIDLVVLDLLLAEGSAGRFLARRSTEPLVAGVPIIGMTARGLPRTQDELVAACAATIAKPFPSEQLVATIRQVLAAAD
jgi:DNA-binding response OmpR family regulator